MGNAFSPACLFYRGWVAMGPVVQFYTKIGPSPMRFYRIPNLAEKSIKIRKIREILGNLRRFVSYSATGSRASSVSYSASGSGASSVSWRCLRRCQRLSVGAHHQITLAAPGFARNCLEGRFPSRPPTCQGTPRSPPAHDSSWPSTIGTTPTGGPPQWRASRARVGDQPDCPARIDDMNSDKRYSSSRTEGSSRL